METLGILLAIVMGLPALLALVTAGVQWHQSNKRMARWNRESADAPSKDDDEEAARALLAWCGAQQAQDRIGVSRSGDRKSIMPGRPNFIGPDAFRRGSFRYSLDPRGVTGCSKGPDGSASVHLLLHDGAGHYFRVERRLFLN